MHLLAWVAVAWADTPEPTVCFQPLGTHDPVLLQAAIRGVRVLYGFPVERLAARPMPAEAWTALRQRWRADRLLLWLGAEAPSTCTIVVGFTSEDVSTTKGAHPDWGVFGLGEIGGRSAMVSSHRLGGGTTIEQSRLRRTVKVTNHEVGHVLGLRHRGGPGCLMNDAQGSIRTVDDETGLLCASNRVWVQNHIGVSLPDLSSFPWWDER